VNKRLLAKLIVTCLAFLLIGSFIGYSYSASLSNNAYVEGGAQPGAPSYTIYAIGGTYYAKNAMGHVEFSGTDAATVANQATATLTHTYPQKVLFQGDFVFSETVILYDYIIVEIQGKITLDDNVDSAIFRNEHHGESDALINHNIEIYGGILDGNKANNAEANPGATGQAEGCISLRGVYDVHIHDIEVRDFNGVGGIYVSPYGLLQPKTRTVINNVLVKGCIGTGSYGGALWITGEKQGHVVISDIVSYNNTIGILVEDNPTFCSITNVQIFDSTNVGLWINWAHNIVVSNIGVYAETKNVGRYLLVDQSENVQISNFIGNGSGIFGSEYDGALITSDSGVKTGIKLTQFDISNTGKTANAFGMRFFNIANSTVSFSTLKGAEYGFTEWSGTSNNILIGLNCQDGGIHTEGTNTHANLCWNGTNWIS
jgi:hypothetical protein